MCVAARIASPRSPARRGWVFAIPLTIGIAAFAWSRGSYLLGAVVDAPATINLGRHENNELVVTDVSIRNAGLKPLELSRFRGSCASCITFGLHSEEGLVDVERLTVPPRQSISLSVRLLVHGTPERPFRAALTCDTNDPRRPRLSIVFEAAVKGWVFASPRELDLGVLLPGQTVRRMIEIRVSGRGEPCRFGRLQSPAPEQVQLAMSPAGNSSDTFPNRGPISELIGTLAVNISAPLRAWQLDDQIRVYETDKDQPVLLIPIRARVLPKLRVIPAAIVLPRMSNDAPDFTAECIVSSTAGHALHVASIELPSEISAAPVARDAAEDRACYRLEWRAEHRPPRGESRSAKVRFRVEMDGDSEIIDVPVRCRYD